MERILNNTYHLFAPLGPTRDAAWAWGLAWLMAGALAWGLARWRGWRTVPLVYVGLLGLFLLLSSPVSYVAMGAGWRLRHILPLSIAALALWGLAVQQLAWLIEDDTLAYWGVSVRAWVVPLLALGCLGPLLGWWWEDNRALIDTFAKPHLVNRVTAWSDANLPQEDGDALALIPLESSLSSLWNRYWGAYAGSQPRWYFLEPMEAIRASSPAELMARNFRYVIVDSRDVVRAGGEARWRAFLGDSARLVKTFPPHPDFHDRLTHRPDVPLTAYVYRLGDFDQRIDQTWGGQLRLLGLDWSAADGSLRAGDSLTLRLFWAREAASTANYSVFVHLYPLEREEVLAQVDGPPAQPQRPTLTWDDPDELYISEPLALALPADLPSGEYRLVLGVYDYLTLQRLALPDGSTYISLPLRLE